MLDIPIELNIVNLRVSSESGYTINASPPPENSPFIRGMIKNTRRHVKATVSEISTMITTVSDQSSGHNS
jgi:hypothetical protein